VAGDAVIELWVLDDVGWAQQIPGHELDVGRFAGADPLALDGRKKHGGGRGGLMIHHGNAGDHVHLHLLSDFFLGGHQHLGRRLPRIHAEHGAQRRVFFMQRRILSPQRCNLREQESMIVWFFKRSTRHVQWSGIFSCWFANRTTPPSPSLDQTVCNVPRKVLPNGLMWREMQGPAETRMATAAAAEM
jgi:hypothetical protein